MAKSTSPSGIMEDLKTDAVDAIAQSNVELLPQTPYLLGLMTRLRDRNTSGLDFARTTDQVAPFNHIPTTSLDIITAADAPYTGVKHTKGVCGVSILRAGACMERSLRECWSGPLSLGHILIQRDPKTQLPVHMYSKFPKGFESQIILIMEPMLATGGSACKAIDILLEHEALEENIIFVNFVASQKGIEIVTSKYPQMRISTAAIDAEIDKHGHILPGLGDFGDRFYGTE